jgi:serine/threonine protein kinase
MPQAPRTLTLRPLRGRANITQKDLSHPAAARPPDDTAPPLRAAKGLVCPRCQRRYDEGTVRPNCPDDGTPLVRATDLAAADGDPMLGRVLAGRFSILARLGAGSMGTVYRAKQAPIGREVAIKILRSDRAIDEVSRARFLREARANSLLTSPNTVTVFDFGQSENGDFYLAMELLEGESLGQRIKRLGRIPVDDAIDTVRQALRSLSEAHAKGIIHRDLKPDNLFYARVRTNERYEEIVKVLDFGIAKMLHNDGELAMNAVETQAGTVFGTPRYMSPEQAQGKPLDARSDLYSLGVILYHMLAGRPPYTDDDAIVVMARHIKTPPRPLSEVAADARIAPEVEALVMRVLSKEPEKRPDSAEALVAELTRVKESVVVNSGVRASLANGLEALLDGSAGSPRSVPPPPTVPPTTPSLLTHDTLSVPLGVPPRSRRWVVPMVLVGVLAAAAVAVLALAGASRRTEAAPAPSATSARTAMAAQPSPPPAATSPVAPATTTAPAGASMTPPAASSAVGKPAPASTTLVIPTVAATALPRTEPTRNERPPRTNRPAGTKPAGTSSAGYGYLE